jgi:hypothetical protein
VISSYRQLYTDTLPNDGYISIGDGMLKVASDVISPDEIIVAAQ